MLNTETNFAIRTLAGLLCALAAATIWGGGAVVSRHLVTQRQEPADLALLRYVGCFPLALAATLVMGKHARLALDWQRLAILLALGGPPYQLLLIAGYGHATAGAGTVLVSGLLPMFSLLVPLLATAQLPAASVCVGAGLAIAGLGQFALAGNRLSFSEIGLLMFGTAALLWAVLNHLIAAWRIHPLQLTVALSLWSPLFLPLYLLARPNGLADMPSHDIVLQIVYHGWLVAFAATLLFFMSVRLVGPAASSAVQALAPCISAALGAVILSEPIGTQQLAGIAVVAAGVVLVALAGQRQPRRE